MAKWEKILADGHVAHVAVLPDMTLVAMRLSLIPVGVPFMLHGAWGVVTLHKGGVDGRTSDLGAEGLDQLGRADDDSEGA